MGQPKKVILVIGPKERLKNVSWAVELAKRSRQFEYRSLPSEVNEAWLQANVPASTSTIVICDSGLLAVGEFIRLLRSNPKLEMSFLPVIWAESKPNELPLATLAPLGINDLIAATATQDEVLCRLELRERDTEERIRMEAERQQIAVREARGETTMKQREEFLGVCAHDLRSPLGLIQSSLSMVLNGDPQKAGMSQIHVDLLNRAKRQATHALSLVNDLLDVMAFELGLKPQYQLANLDVFLKEFHNDYQLSASQKNVGFHYENPVGDWRVLIDADRIRQLLQNLLTNAIKFTESGKNIYLSVSPFQGRRKSDPKYPMVVVSLRDEGRGIPQAELQKIFDRFTQVKDYARAEGRGLGLTVAKQISVLHDGNLWVQSEEGKGSTFFVLFPHVISRNSATPGEVKRGPKKILLGVTAEGQRSALLTELRQWGYEILVAKNGIELVTQSFHFLPDAILLTQAQAKLSESEVYNMLKADPLTRTIPVCFLSDVAKTIPTDAVPPHDHWLRMPFTKNEIEAVLNVSSGSEKAA